MQIINSNEYFEKIRSYKNIILFGCGGKGRQAVDIFKGLGIRISAACDNNMQLWRNEFLPGGNNSRKRVFGDIKTIVYCA